MEGVIQGDPLSMFLYAVGTLPLIQSLKGSSLCVQVWYASACRSLSYLHQWFELLLSKGPNFGLKTLILVMLLTQPSAVWLFMILISLMLNNCFIL